MLIAAVVAAVASAALAAPVFAQWPTTCVDLNDIVEAHLGRTNNVGIYQRVFGDQAEAACQGDHREDVRGVFAWAFDLEPSGSGAAPPPAVAASTLPLANDNLYSAVWRGQTANVRTLVAGGLNANVRTEDNDPLIQEAVWRDHAEIVQILADAGANVNATDADGEPVLREAIWRDHPNIAQILVDAGADVNAKDSDGDPLLFEAVWRGHTEIVRILVNAGADVSAPDARGRSALSRAHFYNHPDIVQILLAAPAVEAELGWPTTCVDLNDIVERHLGNNQNVGIYQAVFGDQAEAGCRGDHREDVRGVFAWAFDDVTSLAVAGIEPLTSIGQSVQLSVTANMSDGSTKGLDSGLVEWSSSDPWVVSVSEGVVTAVGGGNATITAAYEGAKGQTPISVRISTMSTGTVRVLYAVPSDREFRPDYSEAVTHAIVDLQSWYRRELGGLTFSLYQATPEFCQMGEPADYYATGNAWNKVEAGVQHCAPVQHEHPDFVFIIYPDVQESCNEPHELGAGGPGLTILHRGDLEGVTNPGPYFYCDEGPYDGTLGRWIGGLGHELGHAFGLPHPPGCDEGLPTCDHDALIASGYSAYPETYLRADNKDVLTRSPFIG